MFGGFLSKADKQVVEEMQQAKAETSTPWP